MQPRNEKYEIYIRLRTHDRYLIHFPHGTAIVHLLSCSAACEKNNWLINVYIHYISNTHEPIHNCNITKTKQCSTTLRLYFVVYTEESWDCPFRFGRTRWRPIRMSSQHSRSFPIRMRSDTARDRISARALTTWLVCGTGVHFLFPTRWWRHWGFKSGGA